MKVLEVISSDAQFMAYINKGDAAMYAAMGQTSLALSTATDNIYRSNNPNQVYAVCDSDHLVHIIECADEKEAEAYARKAGCFHTVLIIQDNGGKVIPIN